MSEKLWIVVNIGCLECGVSSKIVGVFRDWDFAEKLAGTLQETHDWREEGQNDFCVFPMPEIDVIDEEYRSEPG